MEVRSAAASSNLFNPTVKRNNTDATLDETPKRLLFYFHLQCTGKKAKDIPVNRPWRPIGL
jgi:hypothetical protein